MATRFYLPSSGNAPVNFDGSANWNNPANPNPGNQHPCSPAPSGTALTNRSLAETSASVINQSLKLYVSDPLTAQTLSGNFTAVIKCTEGATTADNALQIILRVMSLDGQTQRAHLYTGQSAALNATVGALGEEMATTAATRIFPSTALSSFACADGDRLSIEIGYRSYDTSATSDNATVNMGDPIGTGDFALTSGLTTSLRPWLEFDGTFTFLRGPVRAPQPVIRNAISRSSSW